MFPVPRGGQTKWCAPPAEREGKRRAAEVVFGSRNFFFRRPSFPFFPRSPLTIPPATTGAAESPTNPSSPPFAAHHSACDDRSWRNLQRFPFLYIRRAPFRLRRQELAEPPFFSLSSPFAAHHSTKRGSVERNLHKRSHPFPLPEFPFL